MTTAPPAGRRSALRSRGLELALAVVLLALVVVPVWPGIFTVDSQALYRHGLEQRSTSWYAPVLGSLWGAAGRLGLPPSAVLVLGAGALLAALAVLLRQLVPRRAALVLLVLVWLWPPVHGLLGWVGRDVWFTAAVLATTAALVAAVREPEPGRRTRWAVLAVALALGAALCRQNGWALVGLSSLLLCWSALCWSAVRPVRPLLRAGSALVLALGLTLGFLVAHERALATMGVVEQHPEQVLYVADLVGTSAAAEEVLLPPDLYPPQDLDLLVQERLRGGSLAMEPPFGVDAYAASSPQQDRVAQVWRRTLREHPVAWAEHRLRLWAAQLVPVRPFNSAHFGSSDLLDWELSPTLAQRAPALNEARLRYLGILAEDRGAPGVLHWPLWYLLLGLAGAAALLAHPASRAVGAVALGVQLALQSALLLLAPVVQFRYQLPQVVLGVVVVAAAVHALRRRSADEGAPVLAAAQGRRRPAV